MHKASDDTRPSITANEKVKSVAFVGTRPSGLQPKSMRSIVLIGLLALLVSVAQAQDVGEVQSKAEFVAGAGDCSLNFAITYNNETIKGSIALGEGGFALRLPPAAARNVIKQQMRDAGIRLTLVPIREINEKAHAYLAGHPELYQQALERARRMGWIEQQSEPLVTPMEWFRPERNS